MSRPGAVVLGLALAVLVARPAAAQVSFGGQASLTGDGEPGIGPRAGIPLHRASPRLSAAASFDWFFPDRGSRASGLVAGATYVELNGNVLYAFSGGRGGLRPYAGAGLNVAHWSIEYEGGETAGRTSGTDLGLNLVGGARFPAARVTPFAEVRLELGGGEHVVLSVGVQSGGARDAGASR